MGRKKLWAERITLPLSTEQLDRIDGALAEGQTRLDLIREAIERELNRRARLRSR
jgi:metal-responsive CopG/Arc/MetJ family transcriptional regulator